MKILITADLHIKESYRGREVRLEDFDTLLQELGSICQNNSIERIIILGDFFHSLSPFIRKDTLQYGKTFVRNLLPISPVLILTGNHDLFRGRSYLDVLSEEGVDVISEPAIIEMDGCKMGFIPYGYEQLAKEISREVDVTLMHADIKDAVLSTGKVMEEGISSHELLSPFVFNGHIHKPQKVGNIICVGSPMQHDFSESGENKRIIVFDTSTKKIESIPILSCPNFEVIEIKKKSDLLRFLKREESDKNYYLLRIPVNMEIDYEELSKRKRVFIELTGNKREHVAHESKQEVEYLSPKDAVFQWIDSMNISEEDKSDLKKRAEMIWDSCI